MNMSDETIFINRELSWLDFNQRVLALGKDKNVQLAERVKFLAIYGSNLDEFFMVRVASLKDMVHANYKKKDIAGMSASEQLEKINERTRELVTLQYNTYNRSLVPLMHQHGIVVIDAFEDLSESQAAFVDRYFEDNVYPVLTPMAVDASRPFPLIRNKTLNIAALLSKKALMRPIGSHNDNERAAKMENLLEDGINAIGLGPQGMGGKYSVMGVNIENTARHPSAIGVAVNVGCWSHRRGHIVFDKYLNYKITTHTGVEL